MSKKRRGKGKRRASPKQLRALAKARAARKRKLRSPGHRKHKVRSYKRKGSRVKAHRSHEAPKRRRRRRKARRAHAAEAPKRRRRRARKSAAPKRRRRRHAVKAYRRKGSRVRRHMSYESPRRRRGGRRHRRGALENPLSGMELAVGALTGVIGYTAADVVDRFLATRADADLVKKVQMPLAEAAPIYLDWYRLGAGVAMAAVPLVGAHFVRNATARSALQFFGFGAAFSVLGKAVGAVAAHVLKDNDYGKRLYGAEIAAADFVGTSGLPTHGVSGLPMWVEGLGACCRGSGGVTVQQPTTLPPVQLQPPVEAPPPPPVSRTSRVPGIPNVPGVRPFSPPVATTPRTPAPVEPPGIVPPPRTEVTSPLNMMPTAAPMLPSAVVGVRGLGHLSPSQRAELQPALNALSQNRDAFAAVQAGTATAEQMSRAQSVTAAYAPQIRTMQGLAGTTTTSGPRRNRYRWGTDAA